MMQGAKFWTNIDADINETKSFKYNTNRDAKESWRDREMMDMDLEGRLGLQRGLRQRLRAA